MLNFGASKPRVRGGLGPRGPLDPHLHPQTKLRKGNVFTPVCQSFCSQGACMAGGHEWHGVCMAGGHAWQRGHVWQGACVVGECMVGGHVWQGGMHGRGTCMAGGIHGRDHAWWGGACVVGDICGRGHVWRGHVWQRACMTWHFNETSESLVTSCICMHKVHS